jgi:hypothetical protein
MKLFVVALILPAAIVLAVAAFGTQIFSPPPSNAPTKGIVWRGQTFATRADFARWLRSHGIRYRVWARQHPSLVGGPANPKAHPPARQKAEAKQAHQKGSDWKLEALGGVAVLAAVSLAVVFVRRRPGGSRRLEATIRLAVRRAVLAAGVGARGALHWAAQATSLLSSRFVAPAAEVSQARHEGSDRKLETIGGAAVPTSSSQGIAFVRPRPSGSSGLATTTQVAVRRPVLAAKGGTRRTMRWTARATSLLSARYAESWANTIRRRRVEFAWYLATGLLAAGLGLVVTVWLSGV